MPIRNRKEICDRNFLLYHEKYYEKKCNCNSEFSTIKSRKFAYVWQIHRSVLENLCSNCGLHPWLEIPEELWRGER